MEIKKYIYMGSRDLYNLNYFVSDLQNANLSIILLKSRDTIIVNISDFLLSLK